MNKTIQHLQNWAEAYFWVPLSLLSVWLFSKLAYLLTGRKPQENVDWIVGISAGLIRCIFLILVLSIFREQAGSWMTKEEKLAHPDAARTQALVTCVALIVFAYLLTHF